MVPVVSRSMLADPARFAGGGGVIVAPVIARRDVGTAVGVGVAGAIIAMAIQHSAAVRQQELDSAINKVGFFPVAQLNTRLFEHLSAAGIKIQSLDNGESHEILYIRKLGDFSKVAMGADAVLDVRVNEEGYYHSLRARSSTGSLFRGKQGENHLEAMSSPDQRRQQYA